MPEINDALDEMAGELSDLLTALEGFHETGNLSTNEKELLMTLGVNSFEDRSTFNPLCPGNTKTSCIWVIISRMTFQEGYFEPRLDENGVEPGDYDMDEFLEDEFCSKHRGNRVEFDDDDCDDYVILIRDRDLK